MFKFKDILAIILGPAFFHLGSIFGHSLSLLWRRSDRDYLDHLLPLKSPHVSLMNLLINIPLSFWLGNCWAKNLFIWAYLGLSRFRLDGDFWAMLSATTHHHFIFTAFKGRYSACLYRLRGCAWFGARDHLQCWWNYWRNRYPRSHL